MTNPSRFNHTKKVKFIKKLTNERGCTIYLFKKLNVRCKKYLSCKYYNECLKLIWKYDIKGFISNCSGYCEIDKFTDEYLWRSDYDKELRLLNDKK